MGKMWTDSKSSFPRINFHFGQMQIYVPTDRSNSRPFWHIHTLLVEIHLSIRSGYGFHRHTTGDSFLSPSDKKKFPHFAIRNCIISNPWLTDWLYPSIPSLDLRIGVSVSWKLIPCDGVGEHSSRSNHPSIGRRRTSLTCIPSLWWVLGWGISWHVYTTAAALRLGSPSTFSEPQYKYLQTGSHLDQSEYYFRREK